jgi:pyruvate formate lyase activating enzyme
MRKEIIHKMEFEFNKNLKEGLFQKRIDLTTTQCLICERRCSIPEGGLGYCQTRINKAGTIYSFVYGILPAIALNPIEKKPLYHFHPGSVALTIGTYGCNLDCFWCQNHHLSHPERSIPELVKKSNNFVSPEMLIEVALQNKCQGTSISFNEPSLLFEYSLDLFKLAKENNLYNTYVSNGYMTEEVVNALIVGGLDAINVDIKGDAAFVRKYCGTDIDKIWRNVKLFKEAGIHVEITTLLIEKHNTNEKMVKGIARRIMNELGTDTPLHLTRFFPHYKSNLHSLFQATNLNDISEGYETAKEVGLEYVYLGNVVNTDRENTYCPNCGNLVIKRSALRIGEIRLNRYGNCLHCDKNIVKM